MEKIKTFEDIKAWQKARSLNVIVYQATNKELFQKDFALKDQIRKSSISVISNIAEGFEGQSKQEFIRFLDIAKASCGELRAQLYVALDVKYLSEDEFKELYQLSVEISKMISGFITYLKNYNSNYIVHDPEEKYISEFEN